MNKKIAIVTDSTALLNEDILKNELVFQLPLQIIIDNNVYREGLDLTNVDFYNKLKKASTPSKTSQPNLGSVVELYEDLKEKGVNQILIIHCSAKLSGTYNTSLNAAKLVGLEVYSIDSQIGTFPLEYLVRLATEYRDKGLKINEIHNEVSKSINHFKLYFSPCNLDQLKRSGRVSGSSHFIGSLLNIRLVLTFKEGLVVVSDKVRTSKKLKEHMYNKLKMDMSDSTIKEISVIHCNNPLEANSWEKELKGLYPSSIIHVRELSAVVGVHTGEGTIGLSWVY